MDDPKVKTPLRVRYYVVGDEGEGKKTLVWCHGYGAPGCLYANMWKDLSKQYRCVFFDNFGWGMNPRLSDCSGLDSEEAAQSWIIEWIQKCFDKLPLPPKFYLAGHSYGGVISSLYASHNIDRVEALLLVSPAGTIPYDPENPPDQYNRRDVENITAPKVSRSKVDKENALKARNGHPQEAAAGVPNCILTRLVRSVWRKRFEKRLPEYVNDYGKPEMSEAFIAAIADYSAIMIQKHTSN